MTRRVPVVPTLIVGLAVATMIYLGFWQLGRAHERDAIREGMIARSHSPVAEYPYARPADPALLYRRVRAACDRVEGWQVRGGEGIDGANGWRHIATCRAVGHSAVFQADMGISPRPDAAPTWAGGAVTGFAVHSPDTRGVADRFGGSAPERPLMIVADTPAPGLAASKRPDPAAENNSSWSYTGQWFLFALTALVIYALALRKRWRTAS
jgi:surfeit locus 1 family protein